MKIKYSLEVEIFGGKIQNLILHEVKNRKFTSNRMHRQTTKRPKGQNVPGTKRPKEKRPKGQNVLH